MIYYRSSQQSPIANTSSQQWRWIVNGLFQVNGHSLLQAVNDLGGGGASDNEPIGMLMRQQWASNKRGHRWVVDKQQQQGFVDNKRHRMMVGLKL